MIRALLSFVLTLGLIGAAALWAVNRVGDGRLMRAASPPISRTIELVAEEIETGLSSPVANRNAPSPSDAEASAPAAPGKAVWRVLGEVGDDESEPTEVEVAADDASRADNPLQPPVEDDDLAEELPEGSDESLPRRVAGNDEALAESALLVRRMLGLYEQTVEAR